MIFGNTQQFAVELVLDSNQLDSSSVTLGFISIWVNGERLGDPDLCVDLNIPADILGGLMHPVGERQATELFPKDDPEIFSKLVSTLFDRGNIDIPLKEEDCEKFCILPGASESFDGDYLFILEFEEEHYVWRKNIVVDEPNNEGPDDKKNALVLPSTVRSPKGVQGRLSDSRYSCRIDTNKVAPGEDGFHIHVFRSGKEVAKLNGRGGLDYKGEWS